MINEDLITYIQSQLRKNHSLDEIKLKLEKAGWHSDDIAEGFDKINPPTIIPKVIPLEPKVINLPIDKKEQVLSTDKYRELPEVATQSNNPIVPITPKAPIITTTIQNTTPEPVRPGIVSYPVSESLIEKVVTSTTPMSSFSAQSPGEVKPIFIPREESIPTLIPKPIPASIQPIPIPKPNVDGITRVIPEGAMITTLSKDIIDSDNLIKSSSNKSSKKKIIIISIIILLCLVGGTVFAMMSGLITIPAFSFIKKDPKVLLLKTPMTLNALSSYKSETHASISLPSFANITNGLVTGEPVISINKDSFSINTEGKIQKDVSGLTTLSEYTLNLRSSLLKEDINSNIKHDGVTSFVSVPNLEVILGESAPPLGTISIKNNEISSLLSLIPSTYAEKLKSADTYNILAQGIPSSLDASITNSIKEFINNTDVSEKEAENIRNTPTYHYQVAVERQEVKKLLKSIVDPLVTNLSFTEKKNIDEALGSTIVNSFDVWVGKSDSLIHQYKISLSLPLSKVISLDDRGISGNVVTLDLQTTFYDFDVPNNISIPEDATPLNDFTKLMTDKNIKNTLSALKPATLILRNAVGSYGKRASLTGSCTDPVPSSLFSPVGHTKGAMTSVGTIASTMNTLLNLTNNNGACFSTLNAWAVAVPLASAPSQSYCVDALGASVILETPLTGTVCK